MAINAREQDIIALRRQRVQSLRIRGLTHEEIHAQLATPFLADGKPNPSYMENPDTGKPFDRSVITRDLQALKKEWRESAAAATEEHQARQYAELAEIKRAAWGAKNPDLALKALEKEMKLLGTLRQPDGITITINLEIVQRFEQVTRELGIDSAQALAEFTEMLLAQSTADTGSGK